MKKDDIIALSFVFALIVLIILSGVKKILPTIKMSNNFEDIIAEIKKIYGEAIARNVEKIYRLETAHFTSDQFHRTYSPGMEAHGSSYPWGWNDDIWKRIPSTVPEGVVTMKENIQPDIPGSGVEKRFLKFRSLEGAVFTLAEFLKRHGNNPGRWFSTNKDAQQKYISKLNRIEAQYV